MWQSLKPWHGGSPEAYPSSDCLTVSQCPPIIARNLLKSWGLSVNLMGEEQKIGNASRGRSWVVITWKPSGPFCFLAGMSWGVIPCLENSRDASQVHKEPVAFKLSKSWKQGKIEESGRPKKTVARWWQTAPGTGPWSTQGQWWGSQHRGEAGTWLTTV